MRHIRLLVACAMAALAFAPMTAGASGTAGYINTVTLQGQVRHFTEFFPCAPDSLYNLTTVTNSVLHVQLQVQPDGSFRAQFDDSATGTFQAVPVHGVGPTLSGTFTDTDSGLAVNPVFDPVTGWLIGADQFVTAFTLTLRNSSGGVIGHLNTHDVNPSDNLVFANFVCGP
jgi:hypothetical protein